MEEIEKDSKNPQNQVEHGVSFSSTPPLTESRKSGGDRKHVREKSFRKLEYVPENDNDRAASIIEELSVVLPGFLTLWKESNEAIQKEVLTSLTTKLNTMTINNKEHTTQNSNTKDFLEPSSKPRDRSQRHSEQPTSRVPNKEGRKNKEKRDSDISEFVTSTGAGGKIQALRNRYSLSYDKNASHNSHLQGLLEKEGHKFKSEGELQGIPVVDVVNVVGAVNIPRRLSLKNIINKQPNLLHTQTNEVNVSDIAFSKRRELKSTKGLKAFTVINMSELFKKNDKLPSTLKFYFDSCSGLMSFFHSVVKDIEIANKQLISNEQNSFDVEQYRRGLKDTISTFASTINSLIQELGLDKKDCKLSDRVMNELAQLRKNGEPIELDSKVLKVGLFKNLLIKQLQSRLLWIGNTILFATSQATTNCVELATTNTDSPSTVLHTFCLFSSICKLLTKALDDFETIITLMKYEHEKVDAKIKKEELEKRKLKIKRIWDINQSHTEDDIYRAAPIEELIVRGTCLQNVDMFYIDTLVTTSLYLNEQPIAFLEILLERFFPPANKFPKEVENQFRLKALKILRVYLTKNYYHIDAHLQFTLRTFVETKLPRAINNPAFVESIKDKLNLKENFEVSTEEKRISPLLVFSETRPFDILQFFEQEVAEQLTILDLDIFKKIQHYELLGQAWSKPKTQVLAINVTEFITRPNKISFWVATCILLQQNLKHRVKTITHFIQIAQKLDELKSYNTMMGVLAGLNSSAISRLHQSNAHIDKRVKQIFEELVAKVNPEKAFKNLRDIMMYCGRPCIPYIGIYLTDLTFIDEGNTNFITVDGVDLPNLPKQQMVCTAINNLTQFQQNIVGEYNLSVKHPLHSFLAELPSLTENDLWELSLEREPRVQQ